MTNAEIVHELILRYARQDVPAAQELYHEDVVVDGMFSFPHPVKVSGKKEMKERFKKFKEKMGSEIPKLYQGIAIRDLKIHQTVDPNVVIAEWTYVTNNEFGETFNPNVIVCEFKDGKIIHSRDYHNNIMRAKANGTLKETLKDLEANLL